jgi:hypothetical protein
MTHPNQADQKAVFKCESAVFKGFSKFETTLTKCQSKCLSAAAKGTATGNCFPPVDFVASDTIELQCIFAAESKLDATIDTGIGPVTCACPAGEACSVGLGCVPLPPLPPPPPPECGGSGFPACDGPTGQSCNPIAFPGFCMCL